MNEIEQQVWKVYLGSNGLATQKLYKELEILGPAGVVAMNLFRAHKASTRAKKYRGHWKGGAYEKKQWSIGNLVKELLAHGPTLGVSFGWKKDPCEEWNPWVIYVDLPSGQASFHLPDRGQGPDYPGEWSGLRESDQHIMKFVAATLLGELDVPIKSPVFENSVNARIDIDASIA